MVSGDATATPAHAGDSLRQHGKRPALRLRTDCAIRLSDETHPVGCPGQLDWLKCRHYPHGPNDMSIGVLKSLTDCMSVRPARTRRGIASREWPGILEKPVQRRHVPDINSICTSIRHFTRA